MKRRSTASVAGFTLVELLVVIGIIGLVLASVIMAKPRSVTTRVAVAARAVAAALQVARTQAMAANTETVMRIDASTGRFGQPQSMHSLPRGMTIALTVAENERAGDVGGVRFYPDGQSSGGEIALTLEGRSTLIAVNWLTGEPQLRK